MPGMGPAALGRREFVRNLEQGQRQQWGQLYRRHEQERRKLSQDWGSLQGRVRQWRTQGKHWDELAGAIRGKSQVRAEWEQGIEGQHRRERAELVRDHGRQSRGVEQEWAAGQQQQERKPAKTNEEHYRQLYEELSKEINQPTHNEEFSGSLPTTSSSRAGGSSDRSRSGSAAQIGTPGRRGGADIRAALPRHLRGLNSRSGPNRNAKAILTR